jgi:hypothetical protein
MVQLGRKNSLAGSFQISTEILTAAEGLPAFTGARFTSEVSVAVRVRRWGREAAIQTRESLRPE